MDENEPKLGPFPGQMGPHTAAAVERLKKGEPGDRVTRREMAEVVGRSCETGDPGYGNVNSAIRHVRHAPHNIIWAWNRSAQAWECLEDTAKAKAMLTDLSSARKRNKRALEIGATVDRVNLDAAQKLDHSVNMAAAGMGYLAANGRFRKRLAAECSEGKRFQEPDTTKLIELMKT